jgi:hypothetical protein
VWDDECTYQEREATRKARERPKQEQRTSIGEEWRTPNITRTKWRCTKRMITDLPSLNMVCIAQQQTDPNMQTYDEDTAMIMEEMDRQAF